MEGTLILRECELYPEYDTKDGCLYDVYFDEQNNSFTAISVDEIKSLHYKLTKNVEDIDNSDKKEILDYCLGEGNYPQTETISERDVFLHGKYIERIHKNQTK